MASSKKYLPLLAVVIAAPVGVGVGYLVGGLLKGQSGAPSLGVGFVPILLLVLWLALAWHELGHVAGGWLSGFKLHLFAAGPLRIDRRGDRFVWTFNRTPSLWGGIAASSPDPQHLPQGDALRRQMLRLVAGGPMASVLGGLLAVPPWLVHDTSVDLAAACLTFAFVSLGIGLVTLIPIGNAGFVNDGKRILNLLRRDEAARRWLSSVTLSTLALHARPRDWPAEIVDATTRAPEVDFDGILSMWLRYSWHLDRQEVADAGHWLARALAHVDQLPAAARPILHCSAADFFARIEPDPARARRHLADASRSGFVSREALAMAEAAVLLAEGDRTGARARVQVARRILESLSGSSREYAAEILDVIEARAGS